MEPISAADPALARIAAAVRASMDEMVAAAVQEIWDQVPAYPGSNDAQLREDVTGHVRAIFDVFLAGLTGGQAARRSEFTMTREQAARRVAQGITLADFLKAFRIGQASDLNAVAAAERLHLHVNTAYYRLDRIAERTGCDVRRLADVMELLIALRLLGAFPAARATAPPAQATAPPAQATGPAAQPTAQDARRAPG